MSLALHELCCLCHIFISRDRSKIGRLLRNYVTVLYRYIKVKLWAMRYWLEIGHSMQLLSIGCAIALHHSARTFRLNNSFRLTCCSWRLLVKYSQSSSAWKSGLNFFFLSLFEAILKLRRMSSLRALTGNAPILQHQNQKVLMNLVYIWSQFPWRFWGVPCVQARPLSGLLWFGSVRCVERCVDATC